MLSEVIGLAKASWQSLNREVGKNLSEQQKRRIRHDVARRLVERRLTEETCISTSEGPGERSDQDGGDDGDGTGGAADCFSVDSHSKGEDLRMSLSESHHCESSPSSDAISGSLSDSKCASHLDYDSGELGSMDSDWLSDVLLSDCQDD